MELLKKISTATVGYGKGTLQELVFAKLKEGESTILYRVAGVVSDIRAGVSDYGPFAKFIGQFVATTVDGKQFSAGTAIMPSTVADLLQGVVMQAKEKGNSVDFAAEIGVQRDAASATGYVFTAKPLMEFAATDRLSKLLSHVGMAPALGHDPVTGEVTPITNASKAKKSA